MLFIFFDISSPLSFWLLVALVIVIIIFHAQIFHFLLYILSIPVIVYSIIRWVVLKVLEALGVVEQKPRKVVDIKGMPDLEMAYEQALFARNTSARATIKEITRAIADFY